MHSIHRVLSVANSYTFKVLYLNNEFIGLCEEFPSVSYISSVSNNSALKGIKLLIKETVSDMLSNNEKIPDPCSPT